MIMPPKLHHVLPWVVNDSGFRARKSFRNYFPRTSISARSSYHVKSHYVSSSQDMQVILRSFSWRKTTLYSIDANQVGYQYITLPLLQTFANRFHKLKTHFWAPWHGINVSYNKNKAIILNRSRDHRWNVSVNLIWLNKYIIKIRKTSNNEAF